MCDFGVSTLAIASIAMSAASAGMGVIGSISQSQAQAAAMRQQQQAATYQAAVAENQRKVAERQATDAEERGRIMETERRRKTAQQIGSQRAALASMGGDINSGSALDIVGDTADAGEFDALTIRNNAARDAYDRRLAGVSYGSDAAMQRYAAAGYGSRASSIDNSVWIGVGSSLISGASTVADKWSMYKSKGVLS